MHGEPSARAMIDALGLRPHPEGGWYREMWRADAPPGERAGGTTIFFLLEAGQASHWHKVDAEELWFWHAGAPLDLSIAPKAGPIETVTLGGDVLAGQMPQGRVPTGWWQAARTLGGWTLVSCAVVPGFEFAGFTLAPKGWEPGARP